MKIYQLHEYSVDYEDFRDWIYGSYLRRERAEEELRKAEAGQLALEERSIKCGDCPFIGESSAAMEKVLVEYPDYCNDKELYIDDYDDCIECQNFYCRWDTATYEIKEVEVEE